MKLNALFYGGTPEEVLLVVKLLKAVPARIVSPILADCHASGNPAPDVILYWKRQRMWRVLSLTGGPVPGPGNGDLEWIIYPDIQL